jgi:hypothetical protein
VEVRDDDLEALVSDWVKRLLILGIAIVIVNDGGRFIAATYSIQDRSRAMAFEAARVAKTDMAINSGWPAAQKIAQEAGLEVLGYQQSPQGATVVTRITVRGTWVMGPASALMSGKPLATPLTIEHRTTQSG